MSKTRIWLNSGCEALADFTNEVPGRFGHEGKLLFKARNEVRLMEAGGRLLAVKRFKRMGPLLQFANRFKRSKALNSYNNACRLVAIGVPTPYPVACIETRDGMGFLKDSYYICDYVGLPPICDGLNEAGDFNREMARAFARFAAMLHQKGVLHHDLNSTNVMFNHADGGYTFTLIDINRMKIYASPDTIPIDECLKNLTRFSCFSDMFRYFLKEYLTARNMPESLYDKAILIKRKHDSAYARKKKITRTLKNIFSNKR